ncbi:MAG: hypothetical protein IJU65_05290 [Desulfovibrio sp.]|nr:hypothetical protein [Desulfovibrio sp.]
MPIETDLTLQSIDQATKSTVTASTKDTASGFGDILASTLETGQSATVTAETEPAANIANQASATTEKPCIAQFMVMTGCDFKTASAALYQYENWQDYLKSDTEIPDLSAAQRQLQAERQSGVRSMVGGTYGARDDFAKPEPFVPDVPGKVLPVFDEESGKATGIGFVSAEGEQKTTASLTDEETIYAHTDGFHIGRAALDNFAVMATGQEGAKFADLDLQSLASNFPTMAEWTARNGENSTWNSYALIDYEPANASLTTSSAGKSAEISSDFSNMVSTTPAFGEYSSLYASAQLNSLLFADL